MARLLIVSNRLPVTVEQRDGALHIARSSGGLATGLGKSHERLQGLWLGFPGDISSIDESARGELEAKLAELRAVPLYLSAEELLHYYDGIANGVIWPCFHYLSDRLPLAPGGWEVYESVNQRFCDLIVEHYRPGDMIWVQDYQLLLVPGMVRKKLPGARIGFFLHIPFPTADIFRILPWRRAILEGLLGADLIGFHTYGYMNHFAATLLEFMGLECDVNRVTHRGREVHLGAYPMGVDAEALSRAAASSDVEERVQSLRRENGDNLVMVGVDRLDYTKGIPRRLLAVERLLQREPSLRGRVKLVQVAVPSRVNIDAYAEIKAQVDELIGRINGAYSTLSSPAIHYLYRSLAEEDVLALYRSSHVALVTPLRDGMNLVAKEFVAARNDEDGVLVLSELAGAAAELAEALQVNPYDIDGVATALRTALTMDPAERQSRMRALRRRVFAGDVHRWATSFIEDLSACGPAVTSTESANESVADLTDTMRTLGHARRVVLFLDYDGTLVPLASTPQLARPDRELMLLLDRLCGHSGAEVHLVSGRAREALELWFSRLPLTLHAEHGFWSKPYGQPWVAAAELPESALARVRPLFEDFAKQTPGSFVEQKAASLSWHYRLVEPDLAARRAAELKTTLVAALANSPLQVLSGDHVLEVRVHGVDKGTVVRKVLATETAGTGILAMGDDTTDEDMFAALPPSAVSIHVGTRESKAVHRIADPHVARRLLWAIASARPT